MKTKVVGTTYQDYISLLPGDSLTLVKEPKNKYDPKAVAVYNVHGQLVGYLPKEKTAEYHRRNKGQLIEVSCLFVNAHLNGKMIILDIEFNDKDK